jgi:hypothetical protein
MEKKIENKLVKVESNILVLRGQDVMLDRDVAELYGVETRVLKQAVRRNEEKFPDSYMFKLTQNEFNNLKISKASQNVTSFGGTQYAPFAFTEKGLYMLATVLKSPDAVDATFAIIETFTKIRELARTMERLNEENVPVDEVKTLKTRSNKLFRDVLTDPLPLKMRKTKFSFNLGVMKISIETIHEQGK